MQVRHIKEATPSLRPFRLSCLHCTVLVLIDSPAPCLFTFHHRAQTCSPRKLILGISLVAVHIASSSYVQPGFCLLQTDDSTMAEAGGFGVPEPLANISPDSAVACPLDSDSVADTTMDEGTDAPDTLTLSGNISQEIHNNHSV